MNNDLTITEQMMTMPLAGETEAGSAEKQPIRLRSGQALPRITGWDIDEMS